jgi:hypothetical protein
MLRKLQINYDLILNTNPSNKLGMTWRYRHMHTRNHSRSNSVRIMGGRNGSNRVIKGAWSGTRTGPRPIKTLVSQSFQAHCGPGVDSASNRNEYQEYFLGGKGGRCVGLTTLPPSCAECLEIRKPQPPGTLRACNGIAFPFTSQVGAYVFLLTVTQPLRALGVTRWTLN